MTTDVTRSGGRLPRFSVRLLLVLVALVACALGWVSRDVRRYRAQAALLNKVNERLRTGAKVKIIPAKPAWLWTLLVGEYAGDIEEAGLWGYSTNFNRVIGLEPGEVAQVAAWARARSLHLGGDGVDDASIDLVARLPELADLWLVDTRVTSEGLARLGGHKTLVELGITSTREFLANHKKLVISGDAIEALATIPGLNALRINGCSLDDKAIGALPKLQGLRTLILLRADLSDADLAKVAELTKLEKLSLDENPGITDAGLKHLAALRDLESIGLDKTSVTGKGLAQLVEALPQLDPTKRRGNRLGIGDQQLWSELHQLLQKPAPEP